MDFSAVTELESQNNPAPSAEPPETSAGKSAASPAARVSIADFAPPPVPMGETVGVKSADSLDMHRFIATVVITILMTTLFVGSLAFGIVSYLKGADPTKRANPYDKYRALPAAVPEPTNDPSDSSNTENSGSGASIEESASGTAGNDQTNNASPEAGLNGSWSITFSQKLVRLADQPDQRVATVAATLRGPVPAGSYVCYERGGSAYQYFQVSQGTDSSARLCEEDLLNSVFPLTCAQYDPAAGVTLLEPLLPAGDCLSESSAIAPGSYRLHSRVFWNCQIAQGGIGAFPSSCGQSMELVSEELTVQ